MDVRCSRCGTEYDFDDALVSERGTTVKCTNCGHQFKVFPGGAGGAPERWVVRKGSGRELVYTSLRDLQRAIAQKQVSPQDFLSRGGSQQLRSLGSIAELEPFFQAQGAAPAVAAAPAPAEPTQRTLLGMSPGSSGSRADDTVPDPIDEPPTVSRGRGPAAAPSGRSAPPPPRSQHHEELEPKTLPRNPAPDVPAEPAPQPTLGSVRPPAYGSGPAVTDADPMGAAFRTSQESFSDEPLPIPGAPRRTAALRWVVGLVLLAGLAFVGGTVGVRYAKSLRTAPTPASAAPDDRVKKLLDQSEAELARGDYESAKEQLDKASALAERDVAVLSALARLEATRADVHWLSMKLVDPKAATQDAESLQAELAQRVDRVKRATATAAAMAPDDKSVIRARIDALRLAGDVQGARALVGALGLDASQPETAYVLGVLDLAEETPTFGAAADRLRTAASVERGFGRARAALVYALGSSSTLEEASSELLKLEVAAPGHPLVIRLRAFLARKGAEAPTLDSAAPDQAAPPAASAPESAAAPPAGAAAGAPTPGEAIPRGDFRRLLEDASVAKRNGDLGRAETLYRAAQSQQPGNVEALAGLGDVARLRGDAATAGGYYESVLRQNPMYLPALIAAADLKWQGGDRTGALTLYKRVANQTDPGSPYGQKAAARIAEAQGSSGGGSEPRPGKAEPASAPAAPEKKPDEPAAPQQPHIDTSDLPGFP